MLPYKSRRLSSLFFRFFPLLTEQSTDVSSSSHILFFHLIQSTVETLLCIFLFRFVSCRIYVVIYKNIYVFRFLILFMYCVPEFSEFLCSLIACLSFLKQLFWILCQAVHRSRILGDSYWKIIHLMVSCFLDFVYMSMFLVWMCVHLVGQSPIPYFTDWKDFNFDWVQLCWIDGMWQLLFQEGIMFLFQWRCSNKSFSGFHICCGSLCR